MKIKRFNESQDTFEPLKIDDEKVYYKIIVNNSVRIFDIALDKLELKKAVYRYYKYDINNFKNKIENNSIVYLNITFNKGKYAHIDFNISESPFDSYINKGEIKVEDYELNAKKFNL